MRPVRLVSETWRYKSTLITPTVLNNVGMSGLVSQPLTCTLSKEEEKGLTVLYPLLEFFGDYQ